MLAVLQQEWIVNVLVIFDSFSFAWVNNTDLPVRYNCYSLADIKRQDTLLVLY